jgi:hypothetical protein
MATELTARDFISHDKKNRQAYDDVFNCVAPSMPDDPEYMASYRFWYPLGADAMDDNLHPV